MALFFSDRLACAQCHAGFNLSGPTVHDGSADAMPSFHNTGLFNVDGRGGYPPIDRGLFDTTHAPADMGRFRAPTLRNIAVTAPYFHNGRFATLAQALAFYVRRDTNPEEWYSVDAGGTLQKFDDLPAQYVANVNTTEVPYNKKVGDQPALTPAEIDDVVAFLQALTDGYQP